MARLVKDVIMTTYFNETNNVNENEEFDAARILYDINHCQNLNPCASTLFDNPQVRKGFYYEKLERYQLLCNACGLRFSKDNFCIGCRGIFRRNELKKCHLNDPRFEKSKLCNSCFEAFITIYPKSKQFFS